MVFGAVWGGVGDVVVCDGDDAAAAGSVVVWVPALVFGSGFGLGSGSKLKWTSSQRCEGTGAGWGGFGACCRGAWVACVGVGGPPAAWRAAAALALAVVLWMRSAGRGGFGEEVEDVDEDEDEEEVVVLWNVGCAAMRAGAAFLAAAASAAATAGWMEGTSSGESGWLERPFVTWRPGGPIRSAAVGEGGAGLWSPPSGFGLAGFLQCVRACGLVSAGGNSSRGLHSGARGVGPGVSGSCAGAVCGSLGRVGVSWVVGVPAADVCGLPGVGVREG